MRPCVGIHKSTSLMSSSLLLQQCPACLVRLTWIVFVIGGRWPYSWCLVGCCFQDLFRIARTARTYIQQLCEDMGCCPEDLPRAMNEREEWRERVRDIRATSTIWWWWWYTKYKSLGENMYNKKIVRLILYILIYIYIRYLQYSSNYFWLLWDSFEQICTL